MVISSQNVNRQLRTWHESLMSCLFGGLKLILHRLAIMVFEPCFEQKQQPSNSGSLAVRAESSTSQVHLIGTKVTIFSKFEIVSTIKNPLTYPYSQLLPPVKWLVF